MRVFISWSGDSSKQVAEALRDWLPTVIQAVKPWVSAADIEKGETWFTSIQTSLTESKGMGIFCLTSDNLAAPWLAFEAGALASQDRGRVATFLFNVDADSMRPPLSLFQATKAHEKADVLSLLVSMNARLSDPLSEVLLSRVFEANWGALETSFGQIHADQKLVAHVKPTSNEMIQEILNTVRRLEKDQHDVALLAQAVEAIQQRSMTTFGLKRILDESHASTPNDTNRLLDLLKSQNLEREANSPERNSLRDQMRVGGLSIPNARPTVSNSGVLKSNRGLRMSDEEK